MTHPDTDDDEDRHAMQHPRGSTAVHPPAQAPQYLGTDDYGQPVYGTPPAPVAGGVAPLQPIVARPWGLYLAGGALGVAALFLLMIGLAIVAAVLTTATVCLTICTLVLRSMWRDYQKGK